MLNAQDVVAVDCWLYYYNKSKLYLYFDGDGYANGQLWPVDIDILSNHTYQSILTTTKTQDNYIRLDVVAVIDKRVGRLIAITSAT